MVNKWRDLCSGINDIEVRRSDGEILVKYPEYERVEDEYGDYMRRKIKRYPVSEVRENPGIIAREIERYKLARRNKWNYCFVKIAGL